MQEKAKRERDELKRNEGRLNTKQRGLDDCEEGKTTRDSKKRDLEPMKSKVAEL